MRRSDRQISTPEAWEIVDKCEYMTVAMTAEDGSPYCVTLTPARIGECVYFHCAKQGMKSDILRRDGRVCVTCVGDTARQTDHFTTLFESAVLFGNAEEVDDDAEKIEALRALCQRHTPLHMAHFDEEIARSLGRTAIWRIRVTSITGKRKV